jgi:hypothetical protein
VVRERVEGQPGNVTGTVQKDGFFVSEQFKGTPAQIAKMDKKQASDFLLDIIGALVKVE